MGTNTRAEDAPGGVTGNAYGCWVVLNVHFWLLVYWLMVLVETSIILPGGSVGFVKCQTGSKVCFAGRVPEQINSFLLRGDRL